MSLVRGVYSSEVVVVMWHVFLLFLVFICSCELGHCRCRFWVLIRADCWLGIL